MSATLEVMEARRQHIPVLAEELLDLVEPAAGQAVVDCTFGTGGHARLIAERLGPSGTLVAIDRDRAARSSYAEFAAQAPCETRFICGEFADALEGLLREGFRADAVVMDLGLSSPQVDASERGFSYSRDAPLDMRMDPAQALTAAEIVNEWPAERLALILRELGEERHAGSVAREIVARRPLASTAGLVEAIRAGLPPAARFGRGHPAKKSFQAIRIAVNGELESLDAALPRAWELLRTEGRLAAIAFHSLEDRRVKRYLAGLAEGCTCPPEFPVCVCGGEPEARLLQRKPVRPGESEISSNPRSASGRLRGAVKIKSPETGGT